MSGANTAAISSAWRSSWRTLTAWTCSVGMSLSDFTMVKLMRWYRGSESVMARLANSSSPTHAETRAPRSAAMTVFSS
ncbi:MAG: hypothetical protein HRT86_07460 [Ilumatobacteraceae bacterium]|nr:hypothetical protein [Ilumatobacteraceae bacterium]